MSSLPVTMQLCWFSILTSVVKKWAELLRVYLSVLQSIPRPLPFATSMHIKGIS